MDLLLQRPGNHVTIRAMTDQGIRVGEDWYPGPLILSPETIIGTWEVTRIEDLGEQALRPVFELNPEIVLLGTGARQVFLPAELMMAFHTRGIGVEVMSTPAACRTFNVLVSEERKVVAALFPASGGEPPHSMQGSSA